MKVIIYNGDSKFTVDNISIPNAYSVADLLNKSQSEYKTLLSEIQQYNFQITSTRGAIEGDEEISMNEDIEREVEEGINWKRESVN